MEEGEGKMMIGMQGETRDRVRDQRIERIEELVSPTQLLDELPLGEEREKAVVRGRGEVGNVLDGTDERVLIVVGPCSVHDPEAALDYAGRLAELSRRLSKDILIAMRVYFEKPRTTTGWKGLINDPHLDGSGDVNTGLRMARQLLLQVLDLGLPVGTEFLDPITPQYIADAVSWGAIGAARPRARSIASSDPASRCRWASRTAPTATSRSRWTPCVRPPCPMRSRGST